MPDHRAVTCSLVTFQRPTRSRPRSTPENPTVYHLLPPKTPRNRTIVKRSHATFMARRVSLSDTETAIKAIEQDGGVILTDFSSISDVEKVNQDALPFISAIKASVRIFQNHPATPPAVLYSTPLKVKQTDFQNSNSAKSTVTNPANNPLHSPFRTQHDCTGNLAPAAGPAHNHPPLPPHH